MLVLQGASPRRRPVHARAAGAAGFTLIELLVTVSIIGVLAALAYPSMTSMINSNRLAGATNEMIATLQLARMEAVRLNAPVTVCRTEDGTTCKAGVLWSSWIILADADRDGTVDDVLRVSSATAPLEVNASAAVQNSSLSFRSDGRARAANGSLLNAQFSVCLPVTKPVDNERLISIGAGSRVSSSSSNAAGKCLVPGDSEG